MTRKLRSLIILSVILLISGCSSIGKTKGEAGRWVLYGRNDMGDWYYNVDTTTRESPNIIKVWEKLVYAAATKKLFIQYGWDKKINNRIEVLELDCFDKTRKIIQSVEHDEEGNILDNIVFPNPKIQPVLSGSVMETLLKKVCSKK